MGVAERFQGANVIDAGHLSPYWGEHAARYVFSLPFVENKAVLDIACGTGYGMAFLKKSARTVTGVDVDIEAAREARSECDERTAVLLADGLTLPFADESFDVVTSFETLEHLHQRGKFLAELNRVTRQDGQVIISTPNSLYTEPINGKPRNPFHVFEYTSDELVAEIEPHFLINELFGQSLDCKFEIPPFYDAEQKLPRNASTQLKLFWWKVLNKFSVKLRDRISEIIWKRPFYPTEYDYHFETETKNSAPVLLVICKKV